MGSPLRAAMPAKTTRILLVDDEQPVQKLLSYPLEKEGYEVVHALDGQQALSAFDDQQFDLVVLDILSALARHPGRVFTRDMLLESVWGDSSYRDPRTIDVHIRHLREKLEEEPKHPEMILTVRGVGYRFRDS